MTSPKEAGPGKRKDIPTPEELRRQKAQKIFDDIKAQDGIVIFTGLFPKVMLPDTNRTLLINFITQIAQRNRRSYQEIGFESAELGSGLIDIRESGSQKLVVINAKGQIRARVSNDSGPFEEGEVTLEEIDVIKRIATVCAIPKRIFDEFGTAEAFAQNIPAISPTEARKLLEPSDLYPRGLEVYVETAKYIAMQVDVDTTTAGREASIITAKNRDNYCEKLLKKLAKHENQPT